MVINDRERPPYHPSQPPEKELKKEKKPQRLSVLGVQCIACAVAVGLAFLLRFAGGTAYEQLRQTFRDCLMRNDLLATLAAMWDGDPLESAVSAPEEGDDNADNDEVSLTPPEGTLSVPLHVTLPAFAPVAAGTLTSGYGYRDNPTGDGRQFHRGVDIAAPAGTAIAAMYGGRVAQVGESASLGRFLLLEHGDGVEVLYAHCSQVLVSEGMTVRGGERVALVGDTGDTTGNHLHVQVSYDGIVYDPSAIVGVTRYA